MDSFIRYETAPRTLEEQVERAKRSVREWNDSKRDVAAMRKASSDDLEFRVLWTIGDAGHWRDVWAAKLRDEHGIVPPNWNRALPGTWQEFANFVEAVWNYEYWRTVQLRICRALGDADTWTEGVGQAWQLICDICERQAEVLDAGLVRFVAALKLRIGTAPQSATLAGYAHANLSLFRNSRLRKAMSVAQGEGSPETTPSMTLLTELQSVVLEVAAFEADSDFISAVASRLESMGRGGRKIRTLDPLDEFIAAESVTSPEARAAEAASLLDSLESKAALSRQEKHVLDRVRAGLKPEQIATELRIGVSTVGVLKHRAVEKLRRVAG